MEARTPGDRYSRGKRRIDRWMVTPEVAEVAGGVYTFPVAHSDHLGLVLQLGPPRHWWSSAIATVAERSTAYKKKLRPFGSETEALMSAVRQSSAKYVTAAGWRILADRGQTPATMKEAYTKLVLAKEHRFAGLRRKDTLERLSTHLVEGGRLAEGRGGGGEGGRPR